MPPKPVEPLPEGDPIKIGSAFSKTGFFARIVAPFQLGIELSVAEINAAGGIVYGGATHQIEWINYDSKSDVATTTKNIQKLVHEDEVDFIVAVGLSSPQALAAQGITEPLKVPILTVPFAKALLGPDKKYSFRNVLTTYESTYGMWEWISQNYPDEKKIALLEKDYVTGKEHAGHLKDAAAKFNLEIVFEDYYAPGTTDFYPLLTKALASNPDVIDHGIGVPAEIAGIVKQARELGFTGRIVGGTDGSAADIAELVGNWDALEGYVNRGFDFDGDLVPQTARDIKTKAGDRTVTHATLVLYETVYIMKEAVEATDSLDPDGFVAWLESNEFETIFGKLRYGGESVYGVNHQLLYPVSLMEVKDGKYSQVYFGAFSYE